MTNPVNGVTVSILAGNFGGALQPTKTAENTNQTAPRRQYERIGAFIGVGSRR
jgi:hypothetical protein